MNKAFKIFAVIALSFLITICSITSVFANIEYDDNSIYLTNATYDVMPSNIDLNNNNQSAEGIEIIIAEDL